VLLRNIVDFLETDKKMANCLNDKFFTKKEILLNIIKHNKVFLRKIK